MTSSGSGRSYWCAASNATTEPSECPTRTRVSSPRWASTRSIAFCRNPSSVRYRVTWTSDSFTSWATGMPALANHRIRAAPAIALRATDHGPRSSPCRPRSWSSSIAATSRSPWGS